MIQKHKEPNLTCSKIYHHLKKLSSIQATNAVYGFKVIFLLLSKKKIFEDLYRICHMPLTYGGFQEIWIQMAQ